MLNIQNLEYRWMIYKIKSFKIFIIFIIFILISLLLITTTFDKKNTTKNHLKRDINITKNIPKVRIIEKKTILEPSYEFMKNINNNIDKTVTLKAKIKSNNNQIHIQKQTTDDDINIILKRFSTNKSPELSLFLAKKYYKQENYKQAYKYAFITNELDSKIEDSWIIFIKSMIKLDRKDKAIKTLKKYISHSNSTKAKKLFNDIYLGKFN